GSRYRIRAMTSRNLLCKLTSIGNVGNHHARTFVRECLRVVPADPLGTTRDDRDFANEPRHYFLPDMEYGLVVAARQFVHSCNGKKLTTSEREEVHGARYCRPPGNPGADRELGALARRPHVDRFRTVWHKDGQMWATLFQGPYEEFIRVSQEGYDRGVRIMHVLGGMSIDIKGKRAIAQTKMTISQRAAVEGVVCDVVCTGPSTIFWKNEKANGALCCAD